MNDDELNKQCQKIDYYYREFLEMQKDLLNTPIEELLARFYFAAFEKCLELEKQEAAELKKQIDQLSNDNHVLKTSFITQQDQIEKMKCGGNCKHSYYANTGGCYDMKCRLTYCDCINCKDKWELAE